MWSLEIQMEILARSQFVSIRRQGFNVCRPCVRSAPSAGKTMLVEPSVRCVLPSGDQCL
jgi:hypothetical protein